MAKRRTASVATIEPSRCQVLGTDLVPCEQSVFPCKGHRPDGVLDRIGVQFETAVLEEGSGRCNG